MDHSKTLGQQHTWPLLHVKNDLEYKKHMCRCLQNRGSRQCDEWICICASRPRWCAKRTQGCILVRARTALCPVNSAAARVALHRSAHSRGYKLSREGADPMSLLRGETCVWLSWRGVCVCCWSVCSFLHSSLCFPLSGCGPCLPFYSF
jgi:hypothetical protein